MSLWPPRARGTASHVAWRVFLLPMWSAKHSVRRKDRRGERKGRGDEGKEGIRKKDEEAGRWQSWPLIIIKWWILGYMPGIHTCIISVSLTMAQLVQMESSYSWPHKWKEFCLPASTAVTARGIANLPPRFLSDEFSVLILYFQWVRMENYQPNENSQLSSWGVMGESCTLKVKSVHSVLGWAVVEGS